MHSQAVRRSRRSILIRRRLRRIPVAQLLLCAFCLVGYAAMAIAAPSIIGQLAAGGGA